MKLLDERQTWECAHCRNHFHRTAGWMAEHERGCADRIMARRACAHEWRYARGFDWDVRRTCGVCGRREVKAAMAVANDPDWAGAREVLP